MNGRQSNVWLLAAGFGVLFALLNLVNLVFVSGADVRDLVATGLGVFLAILGYVRSRGSEGARP